MSAAEPIDQATRREIRRLRNRRYYKGRRLKRLKSRGDVLVAVDPSIVVRTYGDFVAALVARRHDLGWTQAELGERAGLQDGYVGKLEAWSGPQGRVAGSQTMSLWLEALGVAFVPVQVVKVDRGKEALVLDAVTRPPLGNELAHRRRVAP